MPKPHIGLRSLPVQVLPEIKLIGERIGIARKRRKLTQSQVARRTGVSRLSVIKLEMGQPTINIKKIMSISIFFNLESEWEKFLDGEMTENDNQILTRENKIQSLSLGLGKKIRRLREKKGLTLYNLAQALYVSPVTVRKLETKGDCSLGLFAGILCCLGKFQNLNLLFDFKNDLIGQSLDYFHYQDRQKVR